MLDLFWMPVVEPYAISDRFSTAGKINMNFQILPFTYIDRSTGIRALLESEMLTAFLNAKAPSYKRTGYTDGFRKPINVDDTISQFTTMFANGRIFKTESEICDLWIVPQGESLQTMPDYWTSRQLTGDNVRERIYTTLYPRLTTKSNIYTVYFRAQSLKKVKGTPADTWIEGTDVVRGEYRGSTTIERFINPDADVPDYAANPSSIPSEKTLDAFYKWRVIENKKFAP